MQWTYNDTHHDRSEISYNTKTNGNYLKKYIYNNNIAPVSIYLLNGACMNNSDKSNNDVIKSGVPSSMRTCHKYNIM